MEIKLFKKEKNFKKRGSWFDLRFYWEISLCFAFLAIVFSVFFGYYLFRKINQEPTSSYDGPAPAARAAEKEKIENILKYFSARAQKSKQTINSPSPVSDPSI